MINDFYESYNADRYVHYRSVPTGEYEVIPSKRNGKIISVRKPILEKKEISFDEIKSLNLDNYGQDVRTCPEDFSFVHNYLYDYWGAILGTDAIAAYLHLKRYCYGKKDYCFPDMEIIQAKMKKGSRNTVINAMEILEEYGFITKILRYDKERNNAHSSPFFKVRRYIPLLSEELIQQLPEKLRKEHDEFIASTNGIVLENHTNSEVIINQLLQKAKSMKSHQLTNKQEELKRQGKLFEYILSTLSSKEHENWIQVLREISTKISKPSFDTWFSQSIILLNVETAHLSVICPNLFARDWIQDRYKDIIKEVIHEMNDNILVEDLVMSCQTYEEYVKNHEGNLKFHKPSEENIS